MIAGVLDHGQKPVARHGVERVAAHAKLRGGLADGSYRRAQLVRDCRDEPGVSRARRPILSHGLASATMPSQRGANP